MEMTSERLEFEKDNLYRYIPLPQYGEDMYKKELVMSKETFIECYSRWIMGSEAEDDMAAIHTRQGIYDKEEVIGILEEVRRQLKNMRTDFYEKGHKDISFGINIGMEEILRKINKLRGNENGNE